MARSLEVKRRDRESAITLALERLRHELDAAAVPAQLQGRPKHLYSIHKKMLAKALPLAAIHDLLAVRIIVDSVDACYAVLARVHELWSPVPAEFDDYVARPKPNGYQSLHTVVLLEDGAKLEVQIRTRAMHEAAEYGQASHWRYKEGAVQQGTDTFGARIAWVRQLLDWQHEMGVALGADTSQSGLDERVYPLTPQGRVLELPAGATPIDFAYQLHTDLGHRCRGARIDGQLVPLTTVLTSGQTVEIIAARGTGGGPQGEPAGPSRDWLNPALGFLVSTRARGKVRQWFAAREAAREQAEGRIQVERVLQREGRTSIALDKLAERLGFAEPAQLFSAVFHGDVGARAIEQAARTDKPVATEAAADSVIAERLASPASRPADTGILLAGVGALMHHLARCCHPLPPDPIAGFVTLGRGVTIHREDCAMLAGLRARSSERIIAASWQAPGGLPERAGPWKARAGAAHPAFGPVRQGPRRPGAGGGAAARRPRAAPPRDTRRYPVDLVIDGADRPGLLSDLSEILARENTPLTAVRRSTGRDGTRLHLTVEIAHADLLPALLRRLAQVPQVSGVRRG
ncbi:MAG: TGS domain-containing protein [Burkholderiaceae bacterium]